MYSMVIDFLFPKYERYFLHDSISISSGYFLLIGTSSSRSLLLGACKDRAKETSVLSGSVSISGAIPEVLKVILRFEMP